MPLELVSMEPNKAILREYEDSYPQEGEIKVQAAYGSPKHGTEFTIFRGLDPHMENRYDHKQNLFIPLENPQPFFMWPGNMWVGNIIEIGPGVTGLKEGQWVAGYGSLRNTHIIKAEDALIMPEHMTWQEAVCYDAAQSALGGIRDSKLRMGDTVAIFGLGAIGQMAAQMVRRMASLVIVVDPVPRRQEAALANGAHIAFDPTACDVGLEIKKATGNRGADVVIETSSDVLALQQAVRGLTYAGNIAVVSWYKKCQGGLYLGMEAHFIQPNIHFSRAGHKDGCGF
ncbi:MAG: zinc-binding alcohol dehydrogenase [Defluviitaleaceae bacterium]|nr:zinc-binding alcohol dehydrogenase [Defluviitaleaceae bacterium]